ncbi:helix-turn-helix domain-containing protein [Bacillus sp. 165]|uniref:helix-turn-helix domain-containing protein n=1 Tax=Bacillus sp. 165 TaxID=1529117 RepID=UPI001ADD181F|nr:helix-turn-helix domain-containing protein [Bacillus sp. 165]MBO9130689.1 helix-turn-helix domain-containing protein [Bacillus sp. 165]
MSKLYEHMKCYSQFKTVEEFNQYKSYLYKEYKDDLNCTDRQVIDILSRYAVNSRRQSIGVACPLMETMAEKAQKSIRTIRRSVAKLERLGIIKRILMKERRKQGGYSASLYVFQYDDRMIDRMSMSECKKPKKQDVATEESSKSERETLFFFQALNQETCCKVTYETMDETYARNDIPKSFIYAVLPMTQNPKTINFAWSRVTLAYGKSCLPHQGVWLEKLLEEPNIAEELIGRTKSAVRAYKLGEIRKDFGALLYGTMNELFSKVAMDFSASARRRSGVMLYDWIT